MAKSKCELWTNQNIQVGSAGNYNNMKTKNKLGVGMALGIAIGTAIGAATDNLAIWIAIGVALGAGIGVMLNQKRKKQDWIKSNN